MSVGTSVAASAAASTAGAAAGSAAGGAAGGAAGSAPPASASTGLVAAVPALMGAQRFAMYGRMGGAPDDPQAAAAAQDATGWMSGGFGLISPAMFAVADASAASTTNDTLSDGGRRLQSRGGGGGGSASSTRASGGQSDVEAATQQRLIATFTDRLMCTFVSMVAVLFLQYLLLIWWAKRVNREYYAAERSRERRKSVVPTGARGGRRRSTIADVAGARRRVVVVPEEGIVATPAMAPTHADSVQRGNEEDATAPTLSSPPPSPPSSMSYAPEAAATDPEIDPEIAEKRTAQDQPDKKLAAAGKSSAPRGAQVKPSFVGAIPSSEKRHGVSFEGKSFGKNLRAFRRRSRMPKFHSLPQGLLFPNPQVSVILVFSGGLCESATAILGALAAGYPMAPWAVAVSCIALLLVIAFLASQVRRLVQFYTHHREETWQKREPPASAADVEDPLLALLCRLRAVRPRHRAQGEFAVPESEAKEPHRTELALAEAFNCGLGCRTTVARCCFNRKSGHYAGHTAGTDTAGHSLERLQGWMRDGSGSRAGAAFNVVIIVAQLILSINTGFLFVNPWSSTSTGQKVRLGVNIALQTFCAAFTMGPAANDLLNGLGVSLVFICEGLATACLLASTIVMDGAADSISASATGNETAALVENTTVLMMNATMGASAGRDTLADEADRMLRVARALELATASASLLSASIFMPLLLTLYDSILTPIAMRVRKQEPSSVTEVVCAVLVALVVLPMQVAKSFLGINADVTDLVNEYSNTAAEMASTATEDAANAAEEGVVVGGRTCAT